MPGWWPAAAITLRQPRPQPIQHTPRRTRRRSQHTRRRSQQQRSQQQRSQAPATNALAPVAASGPLPSLVADVPLAPAEQTFREFTATPVANLLYVTDTANQLHVLDAASYAVVKTLADVGDSLLADPTITVFMSRALPAATNRRDPYHRHHDADGDRDAARPTPLRSTTPATRFFVGEPFSSYAPSNRTRSAWWTAPTLATVREIPQPGTPVYNPVRDEVLIVAYTLYTADPATGVVTGDLFPELTSGDTASFLWCNGCEWVDNAFSDAASGLIAVERNRHCTGGGCGYDAPAMFLDRGDAARRIPEAQSPLLRRPVAPRPTCWAKLRAPLSQRAIHALRGLHQLPCRRQCRCAAYLAGRLRTTFINPNTNQGYLEDGCGGRYDHISPLSARGPQAACWRSTRRRVCSMASTRPELAGHDRHAAPWRPRRSRPAQLHWTTMRQSRQKNGDPRFARTFPTTIRCWWNWPAAVCCAPPTSGTTFVRLHGGLPEPCRVYLTVSTPSSRPAMPPTAPSTSRPPGRYHRRRSLAFAGWR